MLRQTLLALAILAAAAASEGPPATAAEIRGDLVDLRKEIDDLREEMKSRMSCNEQRNSQLTLEWAMNAVAELRKEMKEVEASNNANGWQQELRNEVSAILAEAEGVTKLAVEDGARLAAGEAKLAELLLDVRQIRELATNAHHQCKDLKDEIKKAKSDFKMGIKILNKKLHRTGYEGEMSAGQSDNDVKQTYRKMRHFRSLHRQLHEMRELQHQMYQTQNVLKEDLMSMRGRIETVGRGDGDDAGRSRVEDLGRTQQRHARLLKNITAEMGNFNKMHVSMLELLENVESLENKVDKAIPDFQREISKLEVDLVQMHSQNEYLKEDHESVHQSVKAIAFSVSNLMDKVNNDHLLILQLNNTLKDIDDGFIYEQDLNTEKSKQATSTTTQEPVDLRLPTSCDDVEGVRQNYKIAPGHRITVRTHCDNGWTLIQRRTNGEVDFNRSFREYESSFGSPTGEFWIGNEALHLITAGNCSTLRIDMVDTMGMHWHAYYRRFTVSAREDGYRLGVNGYTGNVSDALVFQNGMEFSTADHDRDGSRNNCAANYEGGWWFSHCQHVNLNGRYALGLKWFNAMQNKWLDIVSSRMYIRESNGQC